MQKGSQDVTGKPLRLISRLRARLSFESRNLWINGGKVAAQIVLDFCHSFFGRGTRVVGVIFQKPVNIFPKDNRAAIFADLLFKKRFLLGAGVIKD